MNDLKSMIAARLEQIGDTNMIEVTHSSGGDSKLPRELRGQTPDVPRLPTADEVLATGIEDPAEIDGAIGTACEHLLDTDDPCWTDDLCCYPLKSTGADA